MQEHDRKQFVLLIDSLAANFGRPAEEALLEGYWRALNDLPLEAIDKAVNTALRQCQHMPRGVELRELCGDMPIASRAVHAWSSVQRTIAGQGGYASVSFDDPVINATIRNLGGWQRLCSTSTDELEKWTRKDFERIYSALTASGVTAEQCDHLVGAHEQHNAGKGYAIKAPAVVRTGLPPQREGLVRGSLGPRNEEGNVMQLVDGLAGRKAMP